MPGGGTLYLETENVILDENAVYPYDIKPGKFVKITVTDTSIGMDESTRQRIFNPLFTTKAVGVGTGLGLSVSYFIVTEQHKGTIDVTSTPGEGTCFSVRLPLAGKPSS